MFLDARSFYLRSQNQDGLVSQFWNGASNRSASACGQAGASYIDTQ